ncbi:hypothetical protein [Methylocystis bryophila]|uniref:Uncharacterized protein n=1 Tax=Methylocystis bryophila TaxID=655015 RepID=A0A1W6MX82_9HYPH|nr:hypothetical protein [Methylocystis bryophila]ARN82190.1 hypothetical protein B1812_15080 [Methylocystis bryophila]BDV38323.1 hypothetical protein DSM21852_15760 [Methylocystis bryophila]
MKKQGIADKIRVIATAAFGGVAVIGGLSIHPAYAGGPTLTAQGIADGFQLSTFATTNPGNTGCCGGPFGIGVNGQGNVLVGTGSGALYVFKDVNGQTPGSALFTQSSSSFTSAYTASGGVVYGGVGGHFASFNPDGTVANPNVVPGASPYLGMWTNPVTGDIISTSGQGLIDINPTTGTFRVINGQFGDGVSVSPDGKTAYLAQGSINGYDIATGSLVYSSPSISGSDGTGVISGGKFNGDIVVNTNFGEIYLLDPTTNTTTLIATGGTRGDYTQVDPTNGSLFLDYADVVDRLTCPGCSFVRAAPGPVPGTGLLALAFLGLAGVAARARRRLNG